MGLIPLGILSSAGGGFGTYELIETQILGSNAASITFSGLATYASTYKHLQIRATARSSRAAFTSDVLLTRFNADTGSNYASHHLLGNGSSVSSSAFTSQTSTINYVIANDTVANNFGAVVMDILDPYSTTKNTTTRTIIGITSGAFITLNSGLWMNTASVTSITLLAQNGNLMIGSRFSIYGIR
jgi:hypothetical protein